MTGRSAGLPSHRVPAVGKADDGIGLSAFAASRKDLGDTGSHGGQRDLVPPPLAQQLKILGRDDVGNSTERREQIFDPAVVIELSLVLSRHAGSLARRSEQVKR